MNPPKKLSAQHNTQEEHLLQEQQTQASAPLQFQNAEELLRHDARSTPVPDSIATRLQESIDQTPRPPRPWWRRLLGLGG